MHVDEFWEADNYWSQYFFQKTIWIYVDEYRAELTGDEDYIRILIHSGENSGWLFSRPLSERKRVYDVLAKITTPVSEKQLQSLGFVTWQDNYI